MEKFMLKGKNKKLKVAKSTKPFSYKKCKNKQLELDITQTMEVGSTQSVEDEKQKELEQIEQAEQAVSKQKTKNKKIRNVAFFVINI